MHEFGAICFCFFWLHCADFWFADFLRRFLVRRFCAEFLQIFFDTLVLQKKTIERCSGVTLKCAQNKQKNPAASQWLCPNGHPIPAPPFLSTQHVTQSPPSPSAQGEHVSVRRGIFGPKGMLSFAPRFFRNKNLRRIHSANQQPLELRG